MNTSSIIFSFMQELLSRLSNDLVILSADPNLQLYAKVCAGISVALFAIALVMYARKNWFAGAKKVQTETMPEGAAPNQSQNEQETKKGLHYA
jgi:hypothetical protein